MVETVNYNGVDYPKFQTNGFASRFCLPFAMEVCKGVGYDIGCMRKEWAFPGSTPIDLSFNDVYDANNLPEGQVDYIFSSHCLEHISDWVGTLDYWGSKLKKGGVIFLYLPDYSQEYWRPWNNRKHLNIFKPEFIKDYFKDREYNKIFVSNVDLYNSFMVIVEK